MRKMRLLIAGRDWGHEPAEKPSQGPGLMRLEEGRERKRKGNVTCQGSWPPLSIDIYKRPNKKLRQGFIGAPAIARGSENK